MTENVTIIILGGTGDLSRKKLIPSIYQLYKKDRLDEFTVIGTSRNKYTDKEFRQIFTENIENKDKWDEFKKHIKFNQLDFYHEETFKTLKEKLDCCPENRIFYLSTLPQHFEQITQNLGNHDLINEQSKVMYEKPFGHDLQSAKELNNCIHKHFPEDRVYRVDHYLDKELVENISILRFTNTLLQPIWNDEYIDHIQIAMSEDFGVEKRGGFYDETGAIKDVFQNHILQMLALTTMEEPDQFESEEIRNEKVKLLKKVQIQQIITGQYEGYTQEEGVDENSNVETFATMKAAINGWENTPIYLVSGKNLEKEMAQIYIEFKNTPCELFKDKCSLEPNSIVINIKPEGTIYFTINTKVPEKIETEKNKFEFCYSCQHGPNTPEAYENVFWQAIQNNHTPFIRSDEIEEQWKIIDTLKKPQPFTYEKGKFPEEAKVFIQEDGREWYNL